MRTRGKALRDVSTMTLGILFILLILSVDIGNHHVDGGTGNNQVGYLLAT